MMIRERLKGLIPAPHTPMTSDYEINLGAIEKQAELFMMNNLKAVYICGSTGEGMSMTVEERMKVTQRWSEVADNYIKVIVNVGHTCLKDCIALAVFAEKCRAHAISAMPPCYYKPETIEDLVNFYTEISMAAGNVPFFAYHTPVLSGVKFPMLDFLKSASKIPSLGGIKYNHSDLIDYNLCTQFEECKYEVFFGVDGLLLPALIYGSEAAVGSTYNYAAPLSHGIIRNYQIGNMKKAVSLQAGLSQLVNILLKYGVIAAGKAIMKLVGVDCGPTRLPVRALTGQRFEQLCSDLEKINFFSFISDKHS